jgi:nucleoid-associated protein YgaU
MKKKAGKNKLFKSKDDVLSMFLGLVVVVAVGGFVVNFIEKRKGSVDVPGVKNDLKVEELTQPKEEKLAADEVKVVKNDSLWKIAERQYGDGFKWVEIAKLNNIKNPDLIEIGQILKLPQIEKAVADTDTVIKEDREYQVVKGDSLWKIAVREYNDGYQWTKIWSDNKAKLNDPNKLEIGMTLHLRGKI